MLHFTVNKYDCTGCGACKAICPVDCISFYVDEEGFSYPVADSRCINCGKCEKVCPIINIKDYNTKDFNQYCVAGRHIDDNIWHKSASGGAFSAICQAYCEEGDVIFGAKFEELKVVHDCVYSPNDIECFRKSKYVQSDAKDSYSKIKYMLENNRKVLFSGTPCQVAGIRNFLGKEYKNLLCIDLVCHGVGSPGVFERYVEFLEKKYGSKLVSFTFRNKNVKLGRLLQYVIIMEFENSMRIEDEKDLYNTAFIQALFLRPSCGECKFANINRVGDITIADFKKKHELLPEAKGLDNFSTIIINSEKGQKVLEQVKKYMEIYPIDINNIVKTNPRLREASEINKNRANLFQDLEKGEPVDVVLKRYISYYKFYRKIWILLPDRVRGMFKRRIKWLR